MIDNEARLAAVIREVADKYERQYGFMAVNASTPTSERTNCMRFTTN
jgi:hypothetical protein